MEHPMWRRVYAGRRGSGGEMRGLRWMRRARGTEGARRERRGEAGYAQSLRAGRGWRRTQPRVSCTGLEVLHAAWDMSISRAVGQRERWARCELGDARSRVVLGRSST